MARAKRITITMSCVDCKNKNYHFSSNKRKEYKIEVKKFCRNCGKQTMHKETKSS